MDTLQASLSGTLPLEEECGKSMLGDWIQQWPCRLRTFLTSKAGSNKPIVFNHPAVALAFSAEQHCRKG